MRFEIGNKVAVLDDVIKGVITKIKGQIIYIKDHDGMTFEFQASELVKVGVEQRELTKYSNINNHFLNDKLQEKKPRKTAFKKVKNEVIMEVDLHVEKLIKSTRGMDNFDILSLQIDTARRKIEYCIQKKISKIVFIHGVGAGVLKTELEYLFNKYPVKFYDASYQQYGLGATEVYVFQNA